MRIRPDQGNFSDELVDLPVEQPGPALTSAAVAFLGLAKEQGYYPYIDPPRLDRRSAMDVVRSRTWGDAWTDEQTAAATDEDAKMGTDQ